MLKMMLMLGVPVLALPLGGAARASELVVNGGFETTTNGGGQLGYNTDATGWTTNGYNFLFGENDALPGVTGEFGNLAFWTAVPPGSNGGNYVAADGAYGVEPIEQTISGLVAGQMYAVSFEWAVAQQSGYDAPNGLTGMWTVSLGSESHATGLVSYDEHTFKGWFQETFYFTATNSSEVLSFLAFGTPEGVPPFALLDGVSMQAVPEPTSIALMVLGLAGLGAARLRRRG